MADYQRRDASRKIEFQHCIDTDAFPPKIDVAHHGGPVKPETSICNRRLETLKLDNRLNCCDVTAASPHPSFLWDKNYNAIRTRLFTETGNGLWCPCYLTTDPFPGPPTNGDGVWKLHLQYAFNRNVMN